MRRSGTVALSVALVLFFMAMGHTPVAAQYDGYAYPPGSWQYGSPESLDRIGDVLSAIDSPSRRSDLAENWLQFSKSAVAKNLEFRDRWLNLQKQQLSQDQHIEQQRLEMAKLQVQIEQLRAENLRLERENLQLRMELNRSAAAPGVNRPAEGLNGTAGAGPTGEPAPQTPPAARQ